MSERGGSWVDDVRAFRERFGLAVRPEPGRPPRDVFEACWRKVREEFEELAEAVESADVAVIAREIVDSVYSLIGMGLACGLDLDAAWSEVHAANMRKAVADGAVIKPVGWRPPDLDGVLGVRNGA